MSRPSLLIPGALLLVILVLVVFLLDRSGVPGSDKQTAVRIYYDDNISAAHQRVIDKFNQQYRGRIEVVPVSLPFEKFSTNERKELFARSLRNKSDHLDVFAVDLIWVPRFSRWSEPLDAYWSEFLSLGRRMSASGRPFYLFSANDYEGLVCTFFELIAGQDEDFFKKPKFDLESPVARNVLQMLVDFVQKDRISPPLVSEFDEIRSYSYALDNNGVCVRGWPNFLVSYRRWYPDQARVAMLTRAALPHFPGHRPVSVSGSWNLMVSKYSPRKQEAIEFLSFVHREDVQKMLFEDGGYIPTNIRVYADSSSMRLHPDLQYYRQLIEHGFHRPALVEYTRMSDIISRYAHMAIKGEISVPDALHRAAQEIRDNKVM